MMIHNLLFLLVISIFVTACNGSSSTNEPSSTNSSNGGTTTQPEPEPEPEPENIDHILKAKVNSLGMNGDPLDNRALPDITTSSIAQLGRELFFDTQLSGDNDVACVSCHHPQLGGADALSLPIGVGALDSTIVGPGRRHDGNYLVDPEANGGPNVERNSPTTFNIALYDHALFYDGRVQSIELIHNSYVENSSPSHNGEGDLIRTPDSFFNAADPLSGSNLTQAQAKFPLVSLAEMQGFKNTAGHNKGEVRKNIVQKFSDKDIWITEFRAAYNDYITPDSDLITLDKITHALGEYQRSQIFVNTYWKQYLKGSSDISLNAKKGALLFFTDVDNGGAGCNTCHSGDFFTDEKFYNLAVPQIGRGKASQGKDLGRYAISRNSNDIFAQRTPSLINVSETAPYGHSGAFNDLTGIIKHHINPAESINNYDFSLQTLPQMNNLGISYPESESNTRLTLTKYQESMSLNRSAHLRPNTALTAQQIEQLTEFLHTLTDPCILDAECLKPWIAANHRLADSRLDISLAPGFDNSSPLPTIDSSSVPAGHGLPNLGEITPLNLNCSSSPNTELLTGFWFAKKLLRGGIDIDRRFSNEAMANTSKSLNMLINTGSMATGDINGDCKIDLIFTQGDISPIKVYINNGNGYSLADNNWGLPDLKATAGISLVDLNGDGWLDLFVGDLFGTEPKVFLNNSRDAFQKITNPGFKVNHATVGAAFGDIDNDGDIDAFLAHWDTDPGPEEEHLWLNNGSGLFTAGARQYGLVGQFGDRDLVFTPNFVDINKDGKQDLLIAADFTTSQYFIQNNNILENKTTSQSIRDENGMGAAIADFDNDSDLDWFVTSIYDERVVSGEIDINTTNLGWGFSGNRLYRNDINQNGESTFIDIIPNKVEDLQALPDKDNLANGGWGWGACAADFNNDGWVDIYHVNGYSMEPSSIRTDLHYLFTILGLGGILDFSQFNTRNSLVEYIESKSIQLSSQQQSDLEQLYLISQLTRSLNTSGVLFNDSPSRLYVNQKDGTFKEMASEKLVNDIGQGRGVSCFDYDRDGDIDILISNNTGNISFYENKISSTFSSSANYIDLKLIDKAPNIHAVGAKITIETNDGTQYKEVRIENNYVSQNPIESHFGIGSNNSVLKINITWPDGSVQELLNQDKNQMLVIKKP